MTALLGSHGHPIGTLRAQTGLCQTRRHWVHATPVTMSAADATTSRRTLRYVAAVRLTTGVAV